MQRRITNRLSDIQFRSVEDVNESIRPLLQELNSKPLTERFETRAELHQEEVLLMTPLPSIAYELGQQEKILKVRKDYQIRLNNRRFSVPYQYAGKTVRVVCWPHKNILRVYDVLTGKQITEHHYDPLGVKQNILAEHMPPNHLAMMRSKENLLDMLEVFGSNTAELGKVITRNQSLRVARRLLTSILAAGHNLGGEAIENLAKRVLKRPSPTFETFRQELDSLSDTGSDSRSIRPPKEDPNIRGAAYYAKRLKETQSVGGKHE